MTLSVYVDDSLISGPSISEITNEMNEILEHFKGEEVKPKKIHKDGTEERDLLGSTLLYNHKKRTMKIHMSTYIEKMLKAHEMEGWNGKVDKPISPDVDLGGGKSREDVPMRQIVGALLWLAVVCRPDLSYAVQKVAQFADKPTENSWRAAKTILKYAASTKEVGIFYSKENEEAFRETYQQVLDEHNNPNGNKDLTLPDHVGFCDSDFAGCSVTLRSTSGSCIFFKGTAIAWSSKKQSIRAHSTTEAECCGMNDVIRVTQRHGFLNWYLDSGCKLPLIFADNQSAIAISNAKFDTKKSKHFALRLALVKENAKSFGFTPSHLNLADPMTKGLPASRYKTLFDHTINAPGGEETSAEVRYAFSLSAVVEPFHLWEQRFRGGGNASIVKKCENYLRNK
jgi:hypothetical protein